MDLTIESTQNPDYIVFKVSGEWTVATVRNAIDQIIDRANLAGLSHILLDIRDFSLPRSDALRYQTGTYIAKVLGYPYRVAVVGGRPEKLDRFVETVAMNRGAQFRVFADLDPALTWLLSDIAK